ncbi:hypothetical protein [Bosea sp. (in: a-proteobacteria)]|jgi:hypothetical protein|uniref:hypothetical protein n=1 Tax=Bosea sp. (in: a-proteobacteria) TaxID=1871050 RepID=UPI0035694233
MSAVSITIGWWTIPLLASAGAFAWAAWPRACERRGGDFDFAFWLPAAFRLLVAVILALASWLAWSLT